MNKILAETDIEYFNELLVLENSDLESRFLEPDRWTVSSPVISKEIVMNKEDIVEAPWTDEQVVALNKYQHSGRFHPFTGNRHPDGSECILIATNLGWIREEGGPVIQTWAWKFMTQ